MATHAQLAARLLRDAARFYRRLGETDAAITERMETSARACEIMADRVEGDPDGVVEVPPKPANDTD